MPLHFISNPTNIILRFLFTVIVLFHQSFIALCVMCVSHLVQIKLSSNLSTIVSSEYLHRFPL